MEFSTQRELAGRTRLPLRLVLDTAQSPMNEGVRRRDVTSRHLLYQAEGFYLDLRIERDPRGRQAVLVILHYGCNAEAELLLFLVGLHLQRARHIDRSANLSQVGGVFDISQVVSLFGRGDCGPDAAGFHTAAHSGLSPGPR